jgi:hypothetical protein
VYFGDFRTQDLFFNVMNGYYPLDVIDAGVPADAGRRTPSARRATASC